jgi:RNA polymerase sporulation-specific sigma factor
MTLFPQKEDDRSIEEQFSSLTDEEIVLLAQNGNPDAQSFVLTKYKRIVRLKARSYFLIGADHEDLVQEGMIGLYKAIRDYKPERQASFYVFSELCIKRQIISAIKAATRQKHIPLNSYVSLNKPIYDDESDRTLLDVIQLHVSDPEELFINQEELRSIENHIKEVLSPLERDVLRCFLQGKSYVEISATLNKQVKAIDNALQRIKKKMTKYLNEIKK